MTAQDGNTLRFYATEAVAYASRGAKPNYRHLDRFMSVLPAGGSVLELGCGAGQDSEVMISQGFDVSPTDGTPEMAEAAEKRLGRPVAHLLFNDLDAVEAFDGIWANACLLHVPRVDLPGIILRIHIALKTGGAFFASFKAGDAEGRDQFGRYYNYPSENWLRELYSTVAWEDISLVADRWGGYDGKPTDWLYVMAIKGK
ncbi:class I SAM-dependent methyltransferase [Rhizobium sp. BK376]|uniref:class I SAM-dependent methyltransferase n=1 Tax=Rhizobium sp. BK376 TaxID=2512149 RepID=UPI0010ECB88A|nr:class I SAM-dependent methyltransferase [Rhizobium sp. BK376]TCR93251.1 methyltransferase family protein [Rhizobium sp. BK376]